MSTNEETYKVGSYLYSLYHANTGQFITENLNLFYLTLGMIVEKFYPLEFLYILSYLSD